MFLKCKVIKIPLGWDMEVNQEHIQGELDGLNIISAVLLGKQKESDSNINLVIIYEDFRKQFGY